MDLMSHMKMCLSLHFRSLEPFSAYDFASSLFCLNYCVAFRIQYLT